MFSIFKKKPKQTPQPQSPSTPEGRYKQEYLNNPSKYETDAAEIRQLFPLNHPQTKNQMIDFLVQMRLLADEAKIMQEDFNRKKEEENRRREELQRAENQRRKENEERLRQKEEQRQRFLNNKAKKFGYRTRKNFLDNAGRQRGNWRRQNPTADYYSLENFAESNLFRPHDKYTGINNANTLSINSANSNGSNRSNLFGGKRKTLRKLRKH